MLSPSREGSPDRFAITEFLLLRARSVQRSLTVCQLRLSLAGLVEEPLAFLLHLLEMLCDLEAGRPLPREEKAQFFGLLLGLGLAAGELAGLGEFGGSDAQAPGPQLQMSIPAKFLKCFRVGITRFYRLVCHQLQRCKRCGVLSPVRIGISEPLPRIAPRTIHLVELSPALRHPASDNSDGKLISVE